MVISRSTNLLKIEPGKYGLDFYFNPHGPNFVCNASCRGCYVREGLSDEQLVPSDEAPGLIREFRKKGFNPIFPITSELLLAPNWKEIVQILELTYLNTNGILIATNGQSILEELMSQGIEQIVITANISPSHDALGLMSKSTVQKAFSEIDKYRSEDGRRKLQSVATVIITSENAANISSLCEHVANVYKAGAVKFISYIPINGKLSELSPTLDQLEEIAIQIAKMRDVYDKSKLYVERGGSIGSSGLSDDKKNSFCPSGDRLFTVMNLKESSAVTPCIYLPEVQIGSIVDGEIEVDAQMYESFLRRKKEAIQGGYCPALGIQLNKY